MQINTASARFERVYLTPKDIDVDPTILDELVNTLEVNRFTNVSMQLFFKTIFVNVLQTL